MCSPSQRVKLANPTGARKCPLKVVLSEQSLSCHSVVVLPPQKKTCALVTILTGPVKFDWSNPMVKTADLPELTNAKLIIRLLLHECMVPMLGKGEQSSDMLTRLAHQILERCKNRSQLGLPFLEKALDSLVKIAACVQALAGCDFEQDTSVIDAVMKEKTDPECLLFMNAVTQNKWWRNQHLWAAKIVTANKTFGPELSKATAEAPTASVEKLEEFLKRHVVWKEALRSGQLRLSLVQHAEAGAVSA